MECEGCLGCFYTIGYVGECTHLPWYVWGLRQHGGLGSPTVVDHGLKLGLSGLAIGNFTCRVNSQAQWSKDRSIYLPTYLPTFLMLFLFWDKVLLYSLGWSWTQRSSWVLRLKGHHDDQPISGIILNCIDLYVCRCLVCLLCMYTVCMVQCERPEEGTHSLDIEL